MEWIAALFISVFLPLIMIVQGIFFRRGGPKKINHVYGYRTHRAMLNEDTWRFAHRYCGKLWLVCGLILLPLSLIAILCLIDQSNETLGIAAALICGTQIVVLLLGTALPTELALKRTFDKNGNRK